MADLQLAVSVDGENPTPHDLQLVAGQLVLVDDTTQSVAQHLRIRLQFFFAEWFLDQREGIPFFRDVLVKNPSRAILQSIFRRTILQTPGVDSLETFSVTINPDRTASVDFVARLENGDTLTAAELALPFILEGI